MVAFHDPWHRSHAGQACRFENLPHSWNSIPARSLPQGIAAAVRHTTDGSVSCDHICFAARPCPASELFPIARHPGRFGGKPPFPQVIDQHHADPAERRPEPVDLRA